MASRPLLVLIAASLGLGACADATGDPARPAPSATEVPAEAIAPASDPAAVRECNITAADPGTTFGYLADDYKPIKLGLSVVEDKLGAQVWASGTPVAKHDASTPATLSAEGDDLQDVDVFIGHRGQLATNRPFGMGYDSASEIFLRVAAPTVTRMTHTFASVTRTDAFELDPAHRAIETPTGNGDFVSALQGTRVFAYTFSITTQDACASSALADALHKPPTITDVLAQENREAMQKLLVRDHAALAIDVHATRYDKAVADVVFGSACHADDLDACQETLDKLAAFAKAIPATPTYGALVANTDPNWAITDYATRATSTLPD